MSNTLQEILAVRRQKLDTLREQGNAFPNDFKPNYQIGELAAPQDAAERTQYIESVKNNLAEINQELGEIRLVGRIVLHRVMGKSSFAQIQDSTGVIQIYLRRSEDGSDGVMASTYDSFKKWDLGDIVGVTGRLYVTQVGELTIRLSNIKLLTKNLRPLPGKYHGLQDQEARYRNRHLDLISNPEVASIFRRRAMIITTIRRFMEGHGYLEVETPMMHPIPGGTTARPFVTHHNALNADLYLRIAPELYLKKLIVGGFSKVFELNRNFRNEGLSPRHNPEFTMMEFYAANHTYEDLIPFITKMVEGLLLLLTDYQIFRPLVKSFGEHQINYDNFRTLSMKQAVLEHNSWLESFDFIHQPGLKPLDPEVLTALQTKAQEYIPGFPSIKTVGEALMRIFELTTEAKLIQPTFITEFPIESSPLARRNDVHPELADRFELFIAGMEIANGYSELNDAVDQAQRFKDQAQNKAAGDAEAMHYDEDFVTALEYGMPPTAGAGIGIDRLVMLLLNQSNIRDVVLFPQMRLA